MCPSDLDTPTTGNMPNSYADLLPTGKRIRPIEYYEPEKAKTLGDILKDLKERELPPLKYSIDNKGEDLIVHGAINGAVHLPAGKSVNFIALTNEEIAAVTEFIAEWRTRYMAQESAVD